jgi:predicted nucleotidyltransferase
MNDVLQDARLAHLADDALAEFCRRFGLARLALFGSVLRDDFGPDSDVDILLWFKPGFGFSFENTPEIEEELRRLFGRDVDVVELDSIRNPLRRQAIERSYRVVYGA